MIYLIVIVPVNIDVPLGHIGTCVAMQHAPVPTYQFVVGNSEFPSHSVIRPNNLS